MKTVIIEKPVRNLLGLIGRLESHEPKLRLRNVGVDERRTYIYLDDEELQDPTPIVADWEDVSALRLVPMNEQGPDGIPEAKAGGDEAHVVLIEKIDPRSGEVLPGTEELFIRYHGVASGTRKVNLENGTASIMIGPLLPEGEILLHVSDTASELGHSEARLRFVGPPPPPPQDLLPETADSGAIPVSSETLVPEAAGAPIGAGQADATAEAVPRKKPWWNRIFRR